MKKIFVIVIFSFITVFAQPQIPLLKNYANDFTTTLSSNEINTLNSALRKFDDSTSNQIVFLMINSLDGYPLENFTYEIASQNKIGSKKNNNGVLFFVAKDDRKMRIEVGYGLEGALPDALANSILRNEVRPYFKRNDYYSGIASGLSAIIAATAGEYKGNKKEKNKDKVGFPILFIVMIIIFLLFSRGGGKRGGGGILPWLIIGSMAGRGRSSSGWGGGGSGFGGGFGGFSGGGGSFGGGGSSGSW